MIDTLERKTGISLVEVARIKHVPGYVFGLRQPSMVVVLTFPDDRAHHNLALRLRAVLSPHLPPEQPGIRPPVAAADQWLQLALEISTAVAGIQEAAGVPVASAPRMLLLKSGPDSQPRQRMLQLMLPSFAPKAIPLALQWVVGLLHGLAESPDQNGLTTMQSDQLQSLIASLVKFAPRGSNNIRLIRAAQTLGIPIIPLPGAVYQFGWGAHGRLFMSSITDETPAIATSVCKNKFRTNATLHMAGLPVPVGELATTEDHAVAIADRLGYPVVVKPADRDQGVGVAAGLRDAAAVREAFRRALQFSRLVLVEKHLPGTAFRVTLFHGQCVAVVQRLPAGITGDGQSTVEALVAEVNRDPRRSPSRFSIMKPIVIDDESMGMLAELGMSIVSVPAAGEFVALRRAANLSTGGDVIVLDSAHVHPSYLALAARAATLLRLDVAGVDLITEDIRKSAHEVGAALLEVNAQPQMGSVLTHIHAQLLQQYVQRDGTIPTVLVLGKGGENVAQHVRQHCATSLARIGIASPEGIYIGADRLSGPPGNELRAVNALLIDPTVTALLLATDGRNFNVHGLPLPFFDTLVLTDVPGDPQSLWVTLSLLKEHLRGEVLLERNSPFRDMVVKLFGPNRIRPLASYAALADAACQLLSMEPEPLAPLGPPPPK